MVPPPTFHIASVGEPKVTTGITNGSGKVHLGSFQITYTGSPQALTSALVEGTHVDYSWNTSPLLPGVFEICGMIDDAENNAVYAKSTDDAVTVISNGVLFPDPLTFASNPASVSTSSITMTATTATGASNVIQYQFVCAACTDSPWISEETWAATGLAANTQYSFQVKARTVELTPDVTALSTAEVIYTYAAVPGMPTVTEPTDSQVRVTINENSNPAGTEYALYCESPCTDPNRFIDPTTGAQGSTEQWGTYADWGVLVEN